MVMVADIKFPLSEDCSVLAVGAGIASLLGYCSESFLSGAVMFGGVLHPDDRDIAEWLFSPDSTISWPRSSG